MDEISMAHREIAEELDVAVAPVGLAMEKSQGEHPNIQVLSYDREHPSLHGTYLATCVLYSVITDRNPSRSTYVPPPLLDTVTDEEARCLRRVAWESLKDFQSKPSADAEENAKPCPTMRLIEAFGWLIIPSYCTKNSAGHQRKGDLVFTPHRPEGRGSVPDPPSSSRRSRSYPLCGCREC
jgi:hypothetical protein